MVILASEQLIALRIVDTFVLALVCLAALIGAAFICRLTFIDAGFIFADFWRGTILGNVTFDGGVGTSVFDTEETGILVTIEIRLTF